MDDLYNAKKYAMYFIGGRMYTCKEIYDKLRRKGYDEDISEQVISEFTECGYLDDAKYAEMYIIDSVNLGAKGMYRIRQELARKGVSRRIIDTAAAEAEVDTAAALMEYVSMRLATREITTWKEYQKLRAQLARRGYGLDEIKNCLEDFHFELED
ncbi:MAG: regulatory protein RecX [Oscillospiraceae bacterium]